MIHLPGISDAYRRRRCGNRHAALPCLVVGKAADGLRPHSGAKKGRRRPAPTQWRQERPQTACAHTVAPRKQRWQD
jgi:hypothetical protein